MSQRTENSAVKCMDFPLIPEVELKKLIQSASNGVTGESTKKSQLDKGENGRGPETKNEKPYLRA